MLSHPLYFNCRHWIKFIGFIKMKKNAFRPFLVPFLKPIVKFRCSLFFVVCFFHLILFHYFSFSMLYIFVYLFISFYYRRHLVCHLYEWVCLNTEIPISFTVNYFNGIFKHVSDWWNQTLSCYNNYKTVQTNILLEGQQLGPIEIK